MVIKLHRVFIKVVESLLNHSFCQWRQSEQWKQFWNYNFYDTGAIGLNSVSASGGHSEVRSLETDLLSGPKWIFSGQQDRLYKGLSGTLVRIASHMHLKCSYKHYWNTLTNNCNILSFCFHSHTFMKCFHIHNRNTLIRTSETLSYTLLKHFHTTSIYTRHKSSHTL